MPDQNTMTTPVAATLTANELIGLLLDAPARREVRSELIPQRIEPWSLKDELAESLFDFVSREVIIDAIRASEDPSEELTFVIFDLESFADGLRALLSEFRSLAEQNLIDPTETGSALDQEQLDQGRRYARPGPVIDAQDAA